YLDTEIAVVIVLQVEISSQMSHQPAQFVVAEEGGCATTEMQLLNDLVGAEMAGNHLDFLFQPLQIGQRPAPILGDDLVASAVVAGVGAERQVDIERQGARGLAAFTQRMQQIERTDVAVELAC